MDPFSVPLHSIGNRMLGCQLTGIDGGWQLGGGGHEAAPSCPRCASPNTKFCYYNNYSLTQPRYFCKSCRRYWTKGGSLRNVPVGGGCRKSRRSRAARAARANPLSGNPQSSNNSASASGDDLDEQDRISGNGSGAPDIDMAAVFARFLNQNTCPDSELDQLNLNCNVDQESLSNDIDIDPLFAQLANDIDQTMFPPHQGTAVENQPVHADGKVQEFRDGNDLDVLGLIPSMLADGDLDQPSMLADCLWIDPESPSCPNSTWQLHETFPSASADHNWKINSSTSTNLMVRGDNWNSTFDFSGLEVLSRPY